MGDASPAQRLDFVPLLDGLPRATLVAALSLEDVARACCVSRAWRTAPRGDDVRRLWAHLDFSPPQFLRDVSPADVRGACAKAGDALVSVTVHDVDLVPLLSALAPAAHPRLTRVTLRCERGLREAELAGLLRREPPLQELCAPIMLDLDALDASWPLLRHPSLRASRVHTFWRESVWHAAAIAQSGILQRIADTIRAHAATLRIVTVSLPMAHIQVWDDDVAAPLVDALRACTALEGIGLPLFELSATAFASIAAALAARRLQRCATCRCAGATFRCGTTPQCCTCCCRDSPDWS